MQHDNTVSLVNNMFLSPHMRPVGTTRHLSVLTPRDPDHWSCDNRVG